MLMGFAESDSEAQAYVAAFREGLQKLGWANARNIRIDTRWAALDAEAKHRFAKQIVALQPDLILSHNTATRSSQGSSWKWTEMRSELPACFKKSLLDGRPGDG